MAGRQRTTFAKLQRERARQEKQAAKRARRQGLDRGTERDEASSSDGFDPGFGPNGEVPEWLQDADSPSGATPGNSDAS